MMGRRKRGRDNVEENIEMGGKKGKNEGNKYKHGQRKRREERRGRENREMT